MTPYLIAAGSGQQDIVAYLVQLWNGTLYAFHTSGRGKNVLQCTRDAGGNYEVGAKWLLANCKDPDGNLLKETEGTASRSHEEKSSGCMGKLYRNATRYDSGSGKGNIAGPPGLQGHSKGSTSGWKSGTNGGWNGDGNWSGGGQWQDGSWRGGGNSNWNSWY